MYRRLADFIFVFKWLIFQALLLITIVLGFSIFRLEIDPSMETLFIKNSEEYRYYREYSEKYGSDQMIAVAMATPGLFKTPVLRKLDEITGTIAQFESVERVLSLSNAMDIQHKFLGVKIVPVLEGVFKGSIESEKELKRLKEQILDNELFRNNLVSRDGRIANILVYLKPAGKDVRKSGIFIKKLRAYLSSEERPGLKFYMAGSPVEQYDFIRLIRRDQFTFVPLITLLLILATLIIYRSFACMVLAMSIVGMTLVWTMGTIAVLGCQLNLMTSLLAPVVMIVAVINSIYIMNLFLEIRHHHPSLRRSVTLTMEQLGVPCLLTHFTAILGFLSLAINPIPAIRSFGIFAALGTFYSYLVELVLTPILLPILPFRGHAGAPPEESHFFNRFLIGFIENLDTHWKGWVLAGTLAVAGLSVIGINKITVDTNIVKQMKPDLPLAVSTRFIDENLTGVYSLGFVFRRKDGGTFVDYEILRKIDAFKQYLETLPAISKVNAITTIIKKINEARADSKKDYALPQNGLFLKEYFSGISNSADPELRKLISADLKEIQLEARMKAVGTSEGAAVEASARQYLAREIAPLFEYHLTGNVVLLGRMAKGLVDEQVQSFTFAFISILLVIILLFRSLKMGLLAAIPNLIPILMVYGLMGFISIELSTPTAMISSIVLGLVVDAAIQFLYRFRHEFEHRGHYLQALHHTYRSTGQSMVVSTMILCVGFASSAFASFRPTVHFGLLTSLTILLALFCTLVILPVSLLITKPFGPQRLFHRKNWRSEYQANPRVLPP